MVHQIAKSSSSLLLMGGAGYAFGYIAKMDPKITAVAWLVAEIGKQAFDFLISYNEIETKVSEKFYTDTVRGTLCLAMPFALEILNQVHSFNGGILTYFAFSFCLMGVDPLSI